MFVWNIREILGVCVEGAHFLVFADDFFFRYDSQKVGVCGCLWVFVHITRQDVGVCKGDLYAILQSWVFVVFA